MAEGSKKRRPSQSPSRSAADKKIRPASADTFMFSQQSSNDRHLSRAKSDFRGHLNHYFPHTTTSGISLPTSDDYTFRIQVISTTTDVNTDLFKKAVQGLVKICFPQDILEEIGIDIVTQHMHSEEASERNITQMKDIFRSEMIHRVIWMLADYLDTPLKIEASVKAVIAASAGLHGDKIGEDVLGDIIKSLKMLREQVSGSSTQRLVNDTNMETLAHSDSDQNVLQSDDHTLTHSDELCADGSPTFASDRSVNEGIEPPQKSKEKLKLPFEECLNQKIDLSTEAHDYLDDLVSIRRPEDTLGQHTRKGKEGKISTSWRWDVKDDVSPATVKTNFKRASDLFAYHALPVVKRQLGPQAKRKELRQAIQSILTGMSNREFEKWIDSYRKLKQGDITMLQKNTLISALADRRAFSSVPDPGTMETKVISTGNSTTSSDTQRNKLLGIQVPSVVGETIVKHESDVDKDLSEAASCNDIQTRGSAVNMASSTTVEPAIQGTTSICDGHNIARTSQFASTPRRPERRISATPIIDLLWGLTTFKHGQYDEVVNTLVNKAVSRTAVQTVQIPQFDGYNVIQTVQGLRSKLYQCLRLKNRKNKHSNCRMELEAKLSPWVLARVSAFPELLSESFIFALIKPFHTIVLDLVCNLQDSFSGPGKIVVQAQLFLALHQRNISPHTTCGPSRGIISNSINSILGERHMNEKTKRGLLERHLRFLAFGHRDKFPELAPTTLVRTWEQETGQVW